MTTIIITRSARCKDCDFIKRREGIKLTRYVCSNPKSPNHQQQITQKTLVCDKWTFAGMETNQPDLTEPI